MEPLENESEILNRLEQGESLRSICGPALAAAFRRRVVDNVAGLAARYARARNIGLEAIAEQIVELADVCRLGQKTEHKHVGWQCGKCKTAVVWNGTEFAHVLAADANCAGQVEPLKIYEDKTTTGDMVERSKLQLDARKWLLSKMRPDKYGDRVAVVGDPAAPIELNVSAAEVLAKRIAGVSHRLAPPADSEG